MSADFRAVTLYANYRNIEYLTEKFLDATLHANKICKKNQKKKFDVPKGDEPCLFGYYYFN